MKPTAIILLNCPDRQGIITEVTKFITDNRGNIVYLDQYVDRENGVLFMRIEWELEGFLIPRDKIKEYVHTLFSQRFEMEFNVFFSDVKPRMAIFVSKQSHCLYDLLARYKAGEWNVEIPCIVSNHEDLREVADQFGIPSPTAPGMLPRKRFQTLVPAAESPSSEACESGVAPESASTTSPPFHGVPPARALLRPPTQTASPDILLG